MADQREEGKTGGRMLFTDFDASAKGRPVAAFEPHSPAEAPGRASPLQAFPFLNQPIPTIEELASSLDLDFEDDWGDDAKRDARPHGDQPREDERQSRPARRKTEPRPLPGPATDIPTWEEFTKAFRQRPQSAYSFPNRLGQSGTEAPPPAPTAPFPSPPPAETAPPPAPKADADDDFDILSSLPPEAGDETEAQAPDDEDWRGQRLGLEPPRPLPYGGVPRLEEWYRPPETAPGEEGPAHVDDWYEPPEKQTTRRSSHTTQSLDMFSDVDLDALWEEKLRRRRESGGMTSGVINPAQDMFDDIDLEAVWAEKERRAKSGRSRADATATAVSPQATRHRDADSTLIIDPNRLSPATTVVMDGLAPPPPPPPSPPAAGAQPGPDKGGTRAKSGGRKKKRRPAPPPADSDDLMFLDDIGEDDLENGPEDGTGAEPAPAPAGEDAPARSRPPPSSLDELDITHLIDDDLGPGTDDSVTAPIIGDDAIQDTALPPTRKGRDKKETAGADASPAAAAAAIEDEAENDEARTTTARQAPVDFHSLLKAGLPASPAHTREDDSDDGEPAREAALDDGYMDDDDYLPAINDDVFPPVIGDDAIEMPSARAHGGKADSSNVYDEFAGSGDGSEEGGEADADDRDMFHAADATADADHYDEADAADHDGAETAGYDEADAAPEEEEEALDPMDVFSNLENMDFSEDDGLDDDMKAMLEEGEEAEEGEGTANGGQGEFGAAAAEAPPKGWKGKIRYYLGKIRNNASPRALVRRLTQSVAWRENWWFYLDLVAAVIASASIAVIISYFLWYRN